MVQSSVESQVRRQIADFSRKNTNDILAKHSHMQKLADICADLRDKQDKGTGAFQLDRKAKMLAEGIQSNLKEAGVNGIINRVGSMMTMFFTDEEKVNSFESAMKSKSDVYAKYFTMALESGIYLAPSQFECAFTSYVQTDEEINKTIEANLNALKQL